MAAQLQSLIEKFDTFELVRDKIASILVEETAAQVAFAAAAGKPNPNDWNLQVYSETLEPIGQWQANEDNDEVENSTPIVNVSWQSNAYSGKGSTVEKQKTDGVFQIDCYGYGVAREEDGGHMPAGKTAALEAQRAFRLVRNILMSGFYMYLGQEMRPYVGRVWPQSVESMRIEIDGRSSQKISVVQFTLGVHFEEVSPQYEGQPLALVVGTMTDPISRLVTLVRYPYPLPEEPAP